MPSCNLTVDIKNKLILDFNDTLYNDVTVEQDDIEVKVYGPEFEYFFTWTGEFTSNSTFEITTTFTTSLVGNSEEAVIVNFLNTDKFKSIFSERGVNPEELNGFLYKSSGAGGSTESLGQSAMYIFLVSIMLGVISSFGGNSMEMMWNMMNTLQMMFFLSYVNVEFPDFVQTFFSFLDYANLDNEYTRAFTNLIVSGSNFKRGDVNDRIGAKAFYVSSADKVPILVVLVIGFFLTLLFDRLDIQNKNKCVRFSVKSFEYLQYNFFIRFGTEVFLEIVIHSIVNIYWVSFHLLNSIIV
jgi:hypothetical protein